MKTIIFKPPNNGLKCILPKVFLAGSIDMGRAENWQLRVELLLSDYPVAIFNPRRDDWDNTLILHIDNPPFREQVEWELNHLLASDHILYYFAPNGQAPVTLMELGLHASSGKCMVHCPLGFWRKGNVDIVCDMYGVPVYDSLELMVKDLKIKLNEHN